MCCFEHLLCHLTKLYVTQQTMHTLTVFLLFSMITSQQCPYPKLQTIQCQCATFAAAARILARDIRIIS